MHRVRLLSVFFLLLLSFQVTGENNFIINSGHSNPVQTFSRNGKILFSSDNTGTLMIWDTDDGSLVNKIQVSHMMIKELAVNSEGTRIAIVETDTISSFHLSVWDIKENKRIFSHKMDELPLFIKYSPSNNYITYSKTDWNGLRFIDAEKGFEVPFITEDYGIVSSIYITPSEKTLLFYSPSGSIQYWNLSTGKIKTAPIRTRKDLSSITITQNGAFMTASDSNNLYLIDLQTGNTLSTVKISEIIDSTIKNDSKELLVLYKADNNYMLGIWSIETSRGRGILNEERSFKIPYDILPSAGFTLVNRKIFLSGTNGDIITLSLDSGRASIFSDNIMASISDLHILGNEMLLATDSTIISLKSQLFNNGKLPEQPYDIRLKTYSNPFLENTGITANRTNFFIYPMEESRGQLQILEYGSFRVFSDTFTSPIISAEFSNNRFITLEKDGTFQDINATSGESNFSFTSYGINSVEAVYGDNLIAGRNRSAFLNSPLLHINKTTEEIVPIEESNILIFKMDYDPVTRTLYTLGFEQRSTGLMTVLKSHTGRGWELTDTILTYPGEDQAGSFVVDSNKSRIYLAIGNSGMVMYGWNGFTEMESSGHISERLYIHNDLLVSLNTDNSISIWNTNTGNNILDFYLLKTEKWIAVPKGGEAILSDPSLRGLIN